MVPNSIEWISGNFSWLANDAVRWMPTNVILDKLMTIMFGFDGLCPYLPGDLSLPHKIACKRFKFLFLLFFIFFLSLNPCLVYNTKRGKANSLYGPLCAYRYQCTRMHDFILLSCHKQDTFFDKGKKFGCKNTSVYEKYTKKHK